MTEQINSEVNITRRYLDTDGLYALWGKISEVFVRKNNLASEVGPVIENKLKSSLVLYDDKDNNTLYIINQENFNGQLSEDIIISSWDYSDLINHVDIYLDNVSLINISENDPSNQKPGSYLKFEFNTNLDPIYVNITDLLGEDNINYVGKEYIKIETRETESVISLDKIGLTNDVDFINGLRSSLDISSISQSIDKHDEEIRKLWDAIQSLGDDAGGDMSGLLELIDRVYALENKMENLPTDGPITIEEINEIV